MSPLTVSSFSRACSSSAPGAAADSSWLETRPVIVRTSSHAAVPDRTPAWMSPDADAHGDLAAAHRVDARRPRSPWWRGAGPAPSRPTRHRCPSSRASTPRRCRAGRHPNRSARRAIRRPTRHRWRRIRCVRRDHPRPSRSAGHRSRSARGPRRRWCRSSTAPLPVVTTVVPYSPWAVITAEPDSIVERGAVRRRHAQRQIGRTPEHLADALGHDHDDVVAALLDDGGGDGATRGVAVEIVQLDDRLADVVGVDLDGAGTEADRQPRWCRGGESMHGEMAPVQRTQPETWRPRRPPPRLGDGDGGADRLDQPGVGGLARACRGLVDALLERPRAVAG